MHLFTLRHPHACRLHFLDRELGRLLTAVDRRPHDDETWRDAASITQSAMWLTADELAEVNRAITDLLMTRRERLEHPDRDAEHRA